MTLCVVLIIGRSRALPVKDNITSSSINLLVAASVFIVAWLGANEKEANLIAMPYAWLLGTTISVFLSRLGLDDLDGRFGVSQKAGSWGYPVSMVFLVGVYVTFYGVENELIMMWMLLQGVRVVYNWLG